MSGDKTPPPGLVRTDAELSDILRQVQDRRLTYLRPRALRQLARAARRTERQQHPGVMIETGIALGGSAVVLAAAKARARRLLLFDAFGMIPPPTDQDGSDVQARYQRIVRGEATGIGGDLYYGYRPGLLADVVSTFDQFGLSPEANNVELIPGLFEDTLVVDEPVALAHLDGDWYESTMTCLDRIVPRLVVGGRIIIDDYAAWSGCRKAVDEYFRTERGCVFETHARLHVVRVEPTVSKESANGA
jgi:hypothetical protein